MRDCGSVCFGQYAAASVIVYKWQRIIFVRNWILLSAAVRYDVASMRTSWGDAERIRRVALNNIPVLAGEASLQTIKVQCTDSCSLCCVKLLTVKTINYFDSPTILPSYRRGRRPVKQVLCTNVYSLTVFKGVPMPRGRLSRSTAVQWLLTPTAMEWRLRGSEIRPTAEG